MKTTIKSDKIKLANVMPWILFILGTLSYISLIFNNNVWMDEAFTASLINTDMSGVISRSMSDTLPPLYNIYLKIMTDIFGYTVPIMKLASVIPMILTMLLSVTVVRKRHGNLVSSLFCAALFCMPCMLHFGIEIRMYSLGFFFATASGIFAYEVLFDSCIKNWICFTLLSVLAGYSHHFAFVSVGAVYLYILLYYLIKDRAHIKRFFLCLAATFVLYLPCLLVTLKQISRVSGYFSMPDMTLPQVIKYMYYPYTSNVRIISVLLVISVLLLIANCIVLIIKDKEHASLHMYALFMFLIFYGVLAFGAIISRLMTANIFVDRYLFFSFGLIWLFYSIEGVSFTEKFKAGKILYFILLVFTIVIGVCTYTNEFKSEYANSPDSMCSYLNDNVSDGDLIIPVAETEAAFRCLRFYEPKLNYCGDLNSALELFENGQCQSIWIVVDKEDSSLEDLQGIADTEEKPRFIDEYNFDRYDFELYRITN